MRATRDSDISVEPVGKENIGELAELYFRRCDFLKLRDVQMVREYLRRNIESKSHLHGYVIRRGGKIVGSSYMVRVGANAGVVLFIVTDETFAGPERMLAFGKAYRQSIKTLIANGITKLQCSAPKDNTAAIDYCRATGYIQFAESYGKVYFETYFPLLASALSILSGISLDDISLLKLATVCGNPKDTDDSSHTFDFDFKGTRYVLVVDKLSNGLESISCPDFSIGFNYSAPTGWIHEKFKAYFEIHNLADSDMEFTGNLKMQERDSCKVIFEERRLVEGGSSLRFPLEFNFSGGGIKTLTADIETGRGSFELSKTFVISKPLLIDLNIRELLADRIVFDIRNITERTAKVTADFNRGKSDASKKDLSLESRAVGSVPLFENCFLPSPTKTNKAKIRLKFDDGDTATTIDVAENGGIVHFTDGDRFICSNRNLIMEVDSATGILSFKETHDPRSVVFQLPEELGPPFTEYEFNRFQNMPVSHRAASLFRDVFPGTVNNIGLKPQVLTHEKGLSIAYELPGWKGMMVEKKISFQENDEIEIQPTIRNNSGNDIDAQIIFRTCLTAPTDRLVTVPIYRNSAPISSRISENPFFVSEILLEGATLEENWSALGFPGSKRCVGLIWNGDPEYDFLRVWFNKMPWLIYDVNLKDGCEMAFPPMLLLFKAGTWEGVRDRYHETASMIAGIQGQKGGA